MSNPVKLIRITTVPMALAYPLRGQPSYMQDHGFDVLMISADGNELPQLLKNEHCRHMIVPMTRKITPLQDLKCIMQLRKIFKNEKPGLVHTETPKAGLLGMIAAKLAGVKVRIHTVAGMPLMVEKGMKYKILKAVEKITYSSATAVWPNSGSLLKFITDEHLCPPEKMKVISGGSSNGVDTNRFDRAALSEDILNTIKAEIKFDANNIYLLFIGRLVLDKGITELVNVFVKLQKEMPSLKLILAGQYEPDLDPLPAHIGEQIKNHPGIIHISWTNYVEYYMALAQYLVFPSYREGFPNVLLEAASMELPVICSRIGGNVDIVTDNKTGLIFESMNEEDLEQKLRSALADPARMKQMAAALHTEITASFKREKFWEAMRQEYLALLDKK